MNSGVWKEAADLVVEPDVRGFQYDDFAHTADLVRAGEAEGVTATRPSPSRKKAQMPRPAALPAD
jgi:hypothetical protein